MNNAEKKNAVRKDFQAANAAFQSIKALSDTARIIAAPVHLLVNETQVGYHTVAVISGDDVVQIYHLDEKGDLREFIASCMAIKNQVLAGLANKRMGHVATSLVDLAAGFKQPKPRATLLSRVKRLFPRLQLAQQ
jgi:hypothetical protein